MSRIAKRLLAVLVAVGTCAASTSVDAGDWNLLGLYAGAGIGESTVRSDYGFDPYYPTDSHPHHTAYKVMAGIRPIPFVGAEAEYIDFGHPGNSDYFSGTANFGADSHPRAQVLSAVAYLPLPFFDVFAKAGLAHLETNINNYVSGPPCLSETNPYCGAPVLFRQHASENKTAYGAGVQVHLLGLAVRGEYERISSTFGDPDAFLLSATWTF